MPILSPDVIPHSGDATRQKAEQERGYVATAGGRAAGSDRSIQPIWIVRES